MSDERKQSALTKQTWLIVALVLAAFGGGFLVRGGGGSESPLDRTDNQATHALAPEATRWTCSMHPQIILPSNDQKCPICFMDLIPLEQDQTTGLAPGDLALSETAAALADVTTDRVSRRFVTRAVRLVGKVSAD